MALIVPAKPEDATALAAVHVAVWREAYADFLPPRVLAGLSVAQEEAHWRRVLSSSSGWVLAARDGGRSGPVVGFIHGAGAADPDTTARDGEIIALYLRQSRQGRGTGRALFGAGVRRLSDDGFQRLFVWVLERNRRARRFYEHLGGVPDRREDDLSGDARLRSVRYRWTRMPTV